MSESTIVNTYWGPAVEPYEEPEYDESLISEQLSNKMLEGGFDFSGLDSLNIGDGILADAMNDPNSLIHHSNFRAGSGMDNAVDVGYMNHTYIGDDGFRYKMVVSWDEDKQAMKYEEFDERVYRWSPSDEHKRTHRDDAVAESAYGKEFKGGTGTGWYTEAEIKQAWDAGDMRQMKDQGVSWGQYWGYVTGVDQLINDGVIQDYSEFSGPEIYQMQQAGEFTNWSDVPEYMDLVNGLDIPTQFESRGDVYNFNGFGYSRDYWSDKSDVSSELIIGLAVGAMTGGLLTGPLTSAFGAVGLSGSAATAAAKAVVSMASQLITSGDIDLKQALLSAALSYGGDKLGEAISNSTELEGTLSDLVQTTKDSVAQLEELVSTGMPVVDAAIKAGGMSLLTQLVTTGEVDFATAGVAALMAGGQEAFNQFQQNMADSGSELSVDDLQEITVTAQRKGTEVGDGLTQLDNGLVINNEGQILGNMSDLDTNSDGMLSGNDLQYVEVTATKISDKPTYSYTPDSNRVYVDAEGNPVNPVGVKFGPDGYVDGQGNAVYESTYGEVYGSSDSQFGPVDNMGGLVWESHGGSDGVITFEDGTFYAEFKPGVGWVNADGEAITDTRVVDELTLTAAKAIDVPIEQIGYPDSTGRLVGTSAPSPGDSYIQGQYGGTIYGRNGTRYEYDAETGLYSPTGTTNNVYATQDVYYDPFTNTAYVKDSEGKLVITEVELDEVDPSQLVEPTDPNKATGDPNQSTTPSAGLQGGDSSDTSSTTTGTGTPGTSGGLSGGLLGGSLGGGMGGGGPLGGGVTIPPAATGGPVGGGTVDTTDTTGDTTPTVGTTPMSPYEQRIAKLIERGMTRAEAEANQAAAIAAGADANEDGAVTNEEWRAHTGANTDSTGGAGTTESTTGTGTQTGTGEGTGTGSGTGTDTDTGTSTGTGSGTGTGGGTTGTGAGTGTGTGTGTSGGTGTEGTGSGTAGTGETTGGGTQPGGGSGTESGGGAGTGGGTGGGTGPGSGTTPGPGTGPTPGTGTGTGGGGEGDGGGMLSGGGNYTPQWGQLFAYTTLTSYQKEAVAPYVDYIEKARGMMS